MANYPGSAIEDGELTDPELRRLMHEVVRERMRVASDMHVAAYWAAREQHQRSRENSPFPAYDPSELHSLRDVLIVEVRREVLYFRELELTLEVEAK